MFQLFNALFQSGHISVVLNEDEYEPPVKRLNNGGYKIVLKNQDPTPFKCGSHRNLVTHFTNQAETSESIEGQNCIVVTDNDRDEMARSYLQIQMSSSNDANLWSVFTQNYHQTKVIKSWTKSRYPQVYERHEQLKNWATCCVTKNQLCVWSANMRRLGTHKDPTTILKCDKCNFVVKSGLTSILERHIEHNHKEPLIKATAMKIHCAKKPAAIKRRQRSSVRQTDDEVDKMISKRKGSYNSTE